MVTISSSEGRNCRLAEQETDRTVDKCVFRFIAIYALRGTW